MADETDMRDFSKKRPEIWFMINGVKIHAKPAIGMATAQRVLNLRDAMNAAAGGDKLAKLNDLFAVLLHSDSHEAIVRVLADEDDPVDPDQLSDMINYVMEKQGLRPTVPSTPSSELPEHGEPGTPGEDGVLPVA